MITIENIPAKLVAIACTLVLSTTLVFGAVGPATAAGQATQTIHTAA